MHLIHCHCRNLFCAPIELESSHHFHTSSSNDCGLWYFDTPFDLFLTPHTSTFDVDVASCYDFMDGNNNLDFEEEALLLRLLLLLRWRRSNDVSMNTDDEDATTNITQRGA